MTTLTCNHCHQPVKLADAVLRSRSLHQVAFHADCYDVEQVVIPEQRQPDHDSLVRA